jgi:hypothetical protein
MSSPDKDAADVPPLHFDLPAEVIIEGFARAAERVLLSPALVERVADAICLRFELLDPAAAAALLTTTERTLRDNHVEWELDKSTAFGATNPRYFLSQVIDRAKAKVIKGRKPATPQLVRRAA